MAKPKAGAIGSSQDLVRRMCTKASGVMQKSIRFTNNDVPQYLKNLRQFEKESQEVKIVVK